MGKTDYSLIFLLLFLAQCNSCSQLESVNKKLDKIIEMKK